MAQPVSESNLFNKASGLPREAYALLAQANLLRIRGCWEESVECCMAALRLAPESSTAQSLLGDIYENQGQYDDAAQWYRMALDVNPNSPADQMKLQLLQRLRLQRSADDVDVGVDVGDITTVLSDPPPKGKVELLRNPEAALRLGSAAAVLLVLLVVGLAYATTHRHGTYAAFGLPSASEVKLQPVVVPPDQISLAPQSSVPHDATEQSLLDALRNVPELRALGITVIDVKSDPRTSQIELTFGLQSTPGGLTRAYILQMALRLLQSAQKLPSAHSVNTFQIRCLSVSENASAGVAQVFIGDIAQSSIPASDTASTDGRLEALFSAPWWSSSVPS